MTLELNSLEALIVSQALGYMALDLDVNAEDRTLAYEVKEKLHKAVTEQLRSTNE